MIFADVQTNMLRRAGVTEETPFGPDTLVYKVGGKMFATLSEGETGPRMNLKCPPERAIALREEYEAIVPGYHMNKKHWNTLSLDGRIPKALVMELIEVSYSLVRAGLTKSARAALDIEDP